MFPWEDCTLNEDFVRSLKLMTKSVPDCICNDIFMSVSKHILLKHLAELISSGAPYNINNYVRKTKKKRLGFEDFIRIYWDARHIKDFDYGPITTFGHVVNPIEITQVNGDKCSGTYKGKFEIPVSGLYDPTGKVKKGDIVLAHFAMIIGTINENQKQEIINYQSNDKELVKTYRKISEIDYTKVLNNRFQWTKDTYQKYRR